MFVKCKVPYDFWRLRQHFSYVGTSHIKGKRQPFRRNQYCLIFGLSHWGTSFVKLIQQTSFKPSLLSLKFVTCWPRMTSKIVWSQCEQGVHSVSSTCQWMAWRLAHSLKLPTIDFGQWASLPLVPLLTEARTALASAWSMFTLFEAGAQLKVWFFHLAVQGSCCGIGFGLEGLCTTCNTASLAQKWLGPMHCPAGQAGQITGSVHHTVGSPMLQHRQRASISTFSPGDKELEIQFWKQWSWKCQTEKRSLWKVVQVQLLHASTCPKCTVMWPKCMNERSGFCCDWWLCDRSGIHGWEHCILSPWQQKAFALVALVQQVFMHWKTFQQHSTMTMPLESTWIVQKESLLLDPTCGCHWQQW